MRRTSCNYCIVAVIRNQLQMLWCILILSCVPGRWHGDRWDLLLIETILMSLVLPGAATMNCADNKWAKDLYTISVKGIIGRLNRLPLACVGDMMRAIAKKGKAPTWMPSFIVRQRKLWQWKDGVCMHLEGTWPLHIVALSVFTKLKFLRGLFEG